MMRKKRAWRYAHLAGAAYCSATSLTEWNCGDKCASGVTSVQVCRGFGTQAFVGSWEGQGIISFQGTSNPKAFVQNLQVSQTVLSSFCDGCLVHTGFLSEWRSLRECIKKALKDTGRPRGSNPRFTGHSLGAAVSSLAILDLVEDGWNFYESYNFGMPRVGNAQFASLFHNRTAGHFYRVTKRGDPVVNLPPESWNYTHVYPEVFYKGSMREGFQECGGPQDERCSPRVWVCFIFYWLCVPRLWTVSFTQLFTDLDDHLTYMDTNTGSQGCSGSGSPSSVTRPDSPVDNPLSSSILDRTEDVLLKGQAALDESSVAVFQAALAVGPEPATFSAALTVGSMGLQAGATGVQLAGQAVVDIGSLTVRVAGSAALTVGSMGLQVGVTGVQLAGQAVVDIGSLTVRTAGSAALTVGSMGLQVGVTGVQLAGHAVVDIGSLTVRAAGSAALTVGSMGLQAGATGLQLTGQAVVGVGSLTVRAAGSAALTMGSIGLQAGTTGVQLAGQAAFTVGSTTMHASGSMAAGVASTGSQVAVSASVAVGSGVRLAGTAGVHVGSAGVHATASVVANVGSGMAVAASAGLQVGAQGISMTGSVAINGLQLGH